MNVLFYVDNLERATFFSRLACSMHENNLAESRFVTSRLSVYYYLKKKALNVHWIRKNTHSPCLEIGNTLQVLEGRLSKRKASIFVSSLWNAIDSMHQQQSIDLIVDWNGTGVESPAIRQFSQSHGIKTLFVEVANISGKIFADPQGTNAQSFLAQCPAILDQFTVNSEEYEAWRASYLREKSIKHVVPQAKRKAWMKGTYIVDWMGYLMSRRPLPESYGLVRKALWRFVSFGAKWNLSDQLPLKETFVFYPMQVNNDSQLIIHGNMTNHEGIQQASEIAQEHHCQLVVKPHPAEFEKSVIAGIHQLQDQLGFHLSAENTFQLIKKSKSVVTINSTVGLESLLMGKEVRFLAGGILPSLDYPLRLAQYVFGYLIDIDYFGKSPIGRESLIALFARSSLEYKGRTIVA